jgi:cell wall-associated NlpC family hydrolase
VALLRIAPSEPCRSSRAAASRSAPHPGAGGRAATRSLVAALAGFALLSVGSNVAVAAPAPPPLSPTAVRLSAAQVVAEQAAEAYDAARIRLGELSQVAALAAGDAARADAAVGRARQVVGQFAALDYRGGGRPTLLDVLFTASTPQDLLDRTTTLGIVADGRVQALRRLDAALAGATAERAQAATAMQQQQAATASTARAQSRAAQAADDAAAALSAARAREQHLLAQLASLQHASPSPTSQLHILDQRSRSGTAAEQPAPAPVPAPVPAPTRAPASAPAPAPTSAPAPVTAPPGRSDQTGPVGPGSAGEVAVSWARHQLGLPYQWGGAGPDSYDCSGLTMRAWQQAGVDLPHYAASQYAMTQHVAYASLRPGDLIFYATDTGDPGSIHHVSMYVGDGMMIEAPYTGATVRIALVRRDGAMPFAGRP